jgi:hypothetical protein
MQALQAAEAALAKGAVDAQKTVAEIANIEADTEQTGVETAVILDEAMRPPEPQVPTSRNGGFGREGGSGNAP